MSGRRTFLLLLTGGYLAFVGWLTLSPQDSVMPATHWGVRLLDVLHRRGYAESVSYWDLEFGANVALFVPLGVLLTLLFGRKLWWLPVVAAFVMTSAIESIQHHVPGRVPDQRDLVANSLGGAVGVGLALLLLLLTLPVAPRRERFADLR